MRIWTWTRIRIQMQGFDDKNVKNITAERNNIFLIKIAIYVYLGLHKGPLSYRRSRQLSKVNIQHFKS
jgi:hypothetical protein